MGIRPVRDLFLFVKQKEHLCYNNATWDVPSESLIAFFSFATI